jgi:hypothetical protein
MDFLSLLWTAISFVLGVVWTIAWFIIRDLISTLLWLGIAVWALLVVRYRSLAGGSLAFVRYFRTGLRIVWRWVRGKPGDVPVAVETRIQTQYRSRIPLGFVSASAQMNALIVGLLVLMFHL